MADSTYPTTSRTRDRWFVVGIIAAAAGLVTAVLARGRIIRQLNATLGAERQAATAPATMTVTPTPFSPLRTALFIMGGVTAAVLLVALQNSADNAGSILFILLVTGCIGLALRQMQVTIPGTGVVVGLWRLLLGLLRSLRAGLKFVLRIRLPLITSGAILFMALSTASFLSAHAKGLPKEEAVYLLLAGLYSLGVAVYIARPNIALPLLARAKVIPASVNGWLAGLGIAVMALLAEMNGRRFGAAGLYGITTHTQFWMLVVGLTVVAMGLSGWGKTRHAPRVKWRMVVIGAGLVVVSAVATAATSPLPLIPAARLIIDTVLFWTIRMGSALLLWGIAVHYLNGVLSRLWQGEVDLSPLPKSIAANRYVVMALLAAMAALAHPTVVGAMASPASLPWYWMLALVVVGAGLVAVVLWFSRKRAGRRGLVIGLVTVLILANLRGDFAIELGRQMTLNTAIWGLAWLSFAGRGVWSAARARYKRTQAETVEPERRSDRLRHYGLLALILMVAVAARFYLLDDGMRFLVDEDSFLGGTHFLRSMPNLEILAPFSSIAAFPYLYPYWQMLSMDLLGRNFIGLRATSAIIGVLTVPGVYLLARTLFDRKTALLAALLMATFPVHLQFSRIGISEVAGPMTGTLGLAFLGRGLLHQRRRDFVLGGILLGLTHYFHEGGRLLFTPLAIGWITGCLLLTPRAKTEAGEAKRWAARRDNLLAAALALVIAAAPIYYTLVATNRPLFARMTNNDAGLNRAYWTELQDPEKLNNHIHWHILPPFQVYVFQPDSTIFYGGDAGLMPAFVIPAFFLGAAYAIWRWRAPGTMLLLMWVLGTSVGNTLLVDSAGSPRFAPVFPALALLAAVGIRYTIPLLIRHEKRGRILIVVVGIGLALAQVNYYFNEHLPMYNRQFRLLNASPDGYDAALRSVDFPVGTHIHIVAPGPVNQIEAIGTLGLFRDDMYLDTVTPEDFDDEYLDDLNCRIDHAFFLERGDIDSLNRLRKYFFVRAPEFSTNLDIAPDQRLILFYAPYVVGSEVIYGNRC